MDYKGFKEFESELGNVAITVSHIEREERESEKWEKILKMFSPEELVDRVHFSKVDSVGYRPGSKFPHLLLKVDGEWKRMFFCDEDKAHKCFKCLRYRWNSFCQNQ